MSLRLHSCILVFFLCLFVGNGSADVRVPQTSEEDAQMRQNLELRRREREVGKAFHDKTVVSKEEVLKFQAHRDQLVVERNQRLAEEMSKPPTNFPHYAECAAVIQAKDKEDARTVLAGKTTLFAACVVCVVMMGVWLVRKIRELNLAFAEKEKRLRPR
jgi:hypothetical protein